ncbi:hypothetical protein WDV06_36930 [Streptomyces racemochromogenes]|uniref:Uncharacterized protein n=1 Tax=Streptomyces racemochromogenes TaxID=67353 RepID=A0ABW7PQE0_9ACTN
MNYANLNGAQVRSAGGDGDGRAMMDLQARCGWASYLTRDGRRVDPRDITDLTQLAKDLSHAPAPAVRPATAVRFYDPALAEAIAVNAESAFAELWRKVGSRPGRGGHA